MSFIDKSIAERLSEVLTTQDISPIYELLSKHLFIPIDEVKKDYQLSANYVKGVLTIDSNDTGKIFDLFTDLQRFITPSEFDCISTNQLRINLTLFINKVL